MGRVAGRSLLRLCLGAALLGAFCGRASLAQDDGFGPLDPTPPQGVTVDQIIQKFSAQETKFRNARDHYGYMKEVRVETIDDDTKKVDGRYMILSQISFNADGRTQERVINAPTNTLERIMMTPNDLYDLNHGLPYALSDEKIADYNITYVGKQKIDDLDTYAFDVNPKVIDKKQRRFQGRVWVEQQDLQIVVTRGKIVPDDTRTGHEDLSPPFVTYRENIDGKYWFPTYTKADSILHFKNTRGQLSEDVHIRQIVKYTDYHYFGASVKITFAGKEVTDEKPEDAPVTPPAAGAPAPQPSAPPQQH